MSMPEDPQSSTPTRDPRRRFSSRERVALYLAADGRCERCGRELEPGWHADHVNPAVAGGPTRLSNGQALCPRCNLQKGASVVQDKLNPRKFQRELHDAVMARVAAGEMVTVANVSPGSGKTLAYQWILTDLMRRGIIDFGAIYVPRISLATQAETTYRSEVKRGHEVGDFELFHPAGRLERIRHRGNKPPLLPPGATREAFVTCFASLTAQPDVHLQWAQEHEGRFLLIADEAQFCGTDDAGDDLFGGTKAAYYIEQMAQYARHTVLLTGTPYRADKKKLVLADYEQGPDGRLRLISHANARYRDGVGATPEPYLRRFEMSLTRANVELTNDDGETYEDETTSPKLYEYMSSLKPVLRRSEVWQPVVDGVVQRLRFMQRINPNYRALVACMEQSEARAVANYLRSTHPGLKVVQALSEDGPKAEAALREFRTEKADVLVTVRMAFLGYNCPEITVVGVLTNYRDEGHLMQLVFRGGRVWDPAKSGHPAKEQRLHIVTIDDPRMTAFLNYLKNEQDKGIRESDDGNRPVCGGGLPGDPSPWEVTDAYATLTRVEGADGSVSSDDLELLEAVLHTIGPITTVTQLADAVEKLGLLKELPKDGGLFPPPSPSARAPMTEAEIVKQAKGEASEAIGEFLRRRGYKPSDDNYKPARARLTKQINRAFGISSTEAISTKEQARDYLGHVRSWLAGL